MTTITSIDQVMESRLTWPETKPRAARREKGPFRPHEVASEQRELEYELGRWGIKQFIISRNNQRIFAGDPGVAVWWLDKKKQLRVLACDKYETMAANMHALCLTLDAMRALERWGAYTAEQAAEGARPALPPPEGATPINWRVELGVEHAGALPAADLLILANGRYRDLVRAAVGDTVKNVRLNLAIEAARKELSV